MNEVFENKAGVRCVIDDNGITIYNLGETLSITEFFPYGSIDKKLNFGLFGLQIQTKSGKFGVFIPLSEDKERFKKAFSYAKEKNKSADRCEPIITQEEVEIKEHRVRCNVCGKIYCYTDQDLKRNQQLAKQAVRSSLLSVGEALGGSGLGSYSASNQADNAMAQIVDYTKCPNCNSSDIVEIGDDYQAGQITASTTQSQSSLADEIKEFKELLDSGIITQAEFDAKKKQLLGL